MPSSSHHYYFIRTVLRQLAFSRPVELLDALNSPRREELLTELLRITCETVGGAASSPFRVSDIKVSCLLLKNRPCAIIQPPEPKSVGEAYFVAIWSMYEEEDAIQKAIASDPADQPFVEYFTLERASDLTRKCHRSAPESRSSTYFCSWSAEGGHQNHGAGPVPTYEQFVQFLEEFSPRNPDDDFPPIES